MNEKNPNPSKSIIYKKTIPLKEGEKPEELTPALIAESLMQSPQGFLLYTDHVMTRFNVDFRISMDGTRKDITFHTVDTLTLYDKENLSPEGFPTRVTGYTHRIIAIDTVSFYTKVKDGESEMRIYQIGRRHAPDELTIDDYHALAESYHDTENYEEAIKLYDLILKQEPNDVDALVNGALAHACNNEYETAINLYKKALGIEPDDPLIWDNLGIAHEHSGNIQEARKAYLKAAELDPEDEEIQEHLQQCGKNNEN